MPLHLYRRHRHDCKAGHPEDFQSSEFDERRKGWKRCDCPIIAAGTLAKRFKRQSTGAWEWEHARVVASAWETSANWEAPKPEPPPSLPETPVDSAQQRISIQEATEAFLTKCQNRGIRPPTTAKYKTFVKQLRAYADERGYVHVDQLRIVDMDRFYASWNDGVRSKAKKLERLKSFVRFCQKRKWINEDLAGDLQAPQGASITIPKAPFTDDELKRIFEACDAIGPAPGPPRRNWGGEDAKDFIFLSIYTGLRISDVATFDITKRLEGNNVFLRMHKTRRPLFTWIPDWLVARLKARQEKNGALIFRCGVTLNMKQMTDIWRNARLHLVFKLAGPFEERATPHRFRHTFVRILLEKGVPVADVAELIGDTEEMVRRSYSRWIKTRQDRLTKILQEAFEEKVQPTVVPMRRKRNA